VPVIHKLSAFRRQCGFFATKTSASKVMLARAAELVDLEWSQVDVTAAVLHVRRAKKGTPANREPSGMWLIRNTRNKITECRFFDLRGAARVYHNSLSLAHSLPDARPR